MLDAPRRRRLVWRVTRGNLLLDLHEQRIVAAVAEEQHDVVARADAARADQLERDVRRPVALERPLPARSQRRTIGIEPTKDIARDAVGHVLEIGRLVVKTKSL